MSTELNPGTRVEHDRYGQGIISKNDIVSYHIFFAKIGEMEIDKNSSELKVIEEAESFGADKPGVNLSEIEKIITYVLDKYQSLPTTIEMGEKWINGKLVMEPGRDDVQGKEIPIETFFHKIVMVRDKLRVLEQNINSHPKLNDEEKVNLQQYITKAYGSLTSFNVLFEDKEDYFIGQKGK